MTEPIRASKEQALREMMHKLGIVEEDLEEKYVLGSGPGGQKVNKTASCVQLHHRPSGIQVKCQKGRSREQNRFFARRELCLQLEERLKGKDSQRQQAVLAKRKQKKRRARRSQSAQTDTGEQIEK